MSFDLVERTPKYLRGRTSADAMIPLNEFGIAPLLMDVNDKNDLSVVTGLLGQLIILDRENQDKCRRLLAECGALDQISAFFDKRPGDSFTPDYVDLWNLYHYIVEEAPDVIWELGSGISTLVMSYALSNVGKGGRLFAVEPDVEWAANTIAAFPPHLRGCCDLYYSRGEAYSVKGIKSQRFAELPEVMPNMVYIDGAPKDSRYKGAENILLIEDQLEPGTVVFIDGRATACQFFLGDFLKRKWRMVAQSVWLEVKGEAFHYGGQPFGLDLFSNTMVRLIA